MGRRVPIVATIVVVLAAALMIRLGVWQLQRLHEKEALLARFAANASAPPVAFAALWPVREEVLYRRASAYCLSVVGWDAASGRAKDETSGWRHIAHCRTGAEGPGLALDMGVSATSAAPKWTGGQVRGRLIWAPDPTPMIARLFGAGVPLQPMIVAETPAPGLSPSLQPDPADVPNNHLAYAWQWFLFAGIAIAIYAIALWRRGRSVAPADPPR